MTLNGSQGQVPIRYRNEFLLVTRYDRAGPDWQQLTRLRQEDFCQALGIVPEMKYQNEGGPGFAACFDILRQAARPSAPSALRVMDYAVFNALIGNHDAHAKNFRNCSALGAGGRLPCTMLFPRPNPASPNTHVPCRQSLTPQR